MTFQTRFHRPGLLPAGALAALLTVITTAGLAACGSGGTEDAAATSDQPAPATPMSMNVADLVLTADHAPTGFDHENVADLFLDDSDADAYAVIEGINAAMTVEPAECRGLQSSGTSVLAEVHDHPESTAVAEFAAKEDPDMSVIDALVSTADNGQWLGEDLGKCGDFTTTVGDASGESAYTLHSQVSEARVDGAENARVITVTAGDGAPGTWQPVNIVDGHVGPVYFKVSGHGSIDPQMLVGVAQTQVNRITGR